MGDKSPKDREKQRKQHDKKVEDLNRARHEKQQRDQHRPNPDQGKKAG